MNFACSTGNKGFHWKCYSFLTPPQNAQIYTFSISKLFELSEVKFVLLAKVIASGMIVCRMAVWAWCMVSNNSTGNKGVLK
jgi:hypothetical protein